MSQGKLVKKPPEAFKSYTPSEVNQDVLSAIVELEQGGKKSEAIAQELGISSNTVRRYKKHPDFIKISNDYARYYIACRVKELVEALFKEVKKGNVRAIELGLKSVGVIDKKDTVEAGKDTAITVIMPGATNEQVIQVEQTKEENLGGSMPELPEETF